MTGNIFPENVSDFRLIDKKVYQVVNQMDESNKFLRGLIAWSGFNQIGIPFEKGKICRKIKSRFLDSFKSCGKWNFFFFIFAAKVSHNSRFPFINNFFFDGFLPDCIIYYLRKGNAGNFDNCNFSKFPIFYAFFNTWRDRGIHFKNLRRSKETAQLHSTRKNRALIFPRKICFYI